MSRDLDRLEHILEAIGRIEKYASQGKSAFQKDELIQNWIVNHLQIIGEAAIALSPTFRKNYPEVPWKQVVGMRNIIVHVYFQIDANIVWAAVERDLPNLKTRIAEILAKIAK